MHYVVRRVVSLFLFLGGGSEVMMFPKYKSVRLVGEALRRLVMRVWDRDEGLCVVCGRWVEEGTKPHHEPPKSQGGEDIEGDLLLLCDFCHYERHHGRRSREVKEEILEVKRRLGYCKHREVESAEEGFAITGEDGDISCTGVAFTSSERDEFFDGVDQVGGRAIDADKGITRPNDGRSGQGVARKQGSQVAGRSRKEESSGYPKSGSGSVKGKATIRRSKDGHGNDQGKARRGKENSEFGGKRCVRSTKKRGRPAGKIKISNAEIRNKTLKS